MGEVDKIVGELPDVVESNGEGDSRGSIDTAAVDIEAVAEENEEEEEKEKEELSQETSSDKCNIWLIFCRGDIMPHFRLLRRGNRGES